MNGKPDFPLFRVNLDFEDGVSRERKLECAYEKARALQDLVESVANEAGLELGDLEVRIRVPQDDDA